jgi:hypothetical protein
MTEHAHGRVDDDGTVYVRRPDGQEVAVGQWAAGDPSDGLAFFERKYDGLKAEADLLMVRLKEGKGSAENVSIVLAKLRETVAEPHVVREREQAREQAMAARTAIAEEAEQLAASTQWKATGDRFKALQEQWTALPRGERSTRGTEQELWKRFSASRSAFDKARRAHFAALDATRKEAMAAKRDIIARAEELSGSTDWVGTARAYRGLMDEWKAAPRAGRADEDKLWARFRAAQDVFFNARNADEAQALLPITDLAAAKAALRGIAERWNAIGHVPRGDRDRLEGRLRKVEDAVRRAEEDQWRRTDPAKRALAESTVATFRASLDKLEAQHAKALTAGDERAAVELQGRVEQTRSLLEAAENSLSEYSS